MSEKPTYPPKWQPPLRYRDAEKARLEDGVVYKHGCGPFGLPIVPPPPRAHSKRLDGGGMDAAWRAAIRRGKRRRR